MEKAIAHKKVTKYAGLTDDPEWMREERSNPIDWKVVGPFHSEPEARIWANSMHAQGYHGDEGGRGWHYGYTFSLKKVPTIESL